MLLSEGANRFFKVKSNLVKLEGIETSLIGFICDRTKVEDDTVRIDAPAIGL